MFFKLVTRPRPALWTKSKGGQHDESHQTNAETEDILQLAPLLGTDFDPRRNRRPDPWESFGEVTGG